MTEKNYDFRLRHWQYHRPGMRQSDRAAKNNEVWLDGSWKIGCPADAEYITRFAVKDFQDYLAKIVGKYFLRYVFLLAQSFDFFSKFYHKNSSKMFWMRILILL